MEIWGWKEREGIERLHEIFKMGKGNGKKYSRLYNEGGNTKREVEGRAGLRTWGYEKRLEEGKGGELARICWEEMRKRARKGKTLGEWEEERKEFWEIRK